MPRYYRDKIYSKEEKELLWLQKLDKGDTWVMGEKCKIDSNEYKNLLSYYREQAKQIHGDNIALWKETQYWRRLEKQRNIYRKRRNMNEYIDRPSINRRRPSLISHTRAECGMNSINIRLPLPVTKIISKSIRNATRRAVMKIQTRDIIAFGEL